MKKPKKRIISGMLTIHAIYICCIVIILALVILVFSKTDVVKRADINAAYNELLNNSITIVISISCSIIASIIYARIMKEKGEQDREIIKEDLKQITDQIYDEKIDDGVRRISQKVLEIYNDTTDMMPSLYYRSADFPNQEFNTFLDKKIIESKKFIYYGESARFTCKRLYKLKDKGSEIKNLKVEIYIVNPTCNKIFESNKAFLATKEKNRNYGKMRAWDIIIEEEKLKVLYCLYALKEMTKFFQKVDIFLIKDVPFIDIEMTDDTVVLEFFRTRRDYKRYPLAIIYDDKKPYYESYEFYLEWEKEKAIHLDASKLTTNAILNLGRKAGIKSLTETKLKKFCDKEIFMESEQYI